MSRRFIALGALLALLAVAIGAFGAHALKPLLTPEAKIWYQTGVTYHMFHALGLILIGLLAQLQPQAKLKLAGYSLLVGVVLFSGSLYLMAITQIRWLGAITPLGGLAFLVGWGSLFWSQWRTEK